MFKFGEAGPLVYITLLLVAGCSMSGHVKVTCQAFWAIFKWHDIHQLQPSSSRSVTHAAVCCLLTTNYRCILVLTVDLTACLLCYVINHRTVKSVPVMIFVIAFANWIRSSLLYLCPCIYDKVCPVSLSVVVFIASLAALSPTESVDEVLYFGHTVF